MAATIATSRPEITRPLPTNLTLEHLKESRQVLNKLSDIADTPEEINKTHLLHLAALFIKHKAHTRLGVHLLHSHSRLQPEHVLLGRQISGLKGGIWTRPVPTADVDLAAIHGQIFKLVDDGRFVAYEFHDGVCHDLSDISVDFFTELASYLLTHDLQDVLGLEILSTTPASRQVEVDFADWGTVLLDDDNIPDERTFRETGWHFYARPDGVAEYGTGIRHIKDHDGEHVTTVVINSPDPKVKGRRPVVEGDILSVLRHFDIVN